MGPLPAEKPALTGYTPPDAFVISDARPSARQGTLKLSATVFALAAAACVIHVLFNGRYGYFRDELYYAACGEHLAWGYVDHAPLVAFIASAGKNRSAKSESPSSARATRAMKATSGAWSTYPQARCSPQAA